MTRKELIKKVALKMDEISSSDDVIVSVSAEDNNPLYAQIDSLLNESVNDVLTKAPIYRLHQHVSSVSESTSGTVPCYPDPRKKAIISVPSDFIRIVSITDANLQRPIVELALEGDDTDRKQHNKFLVARDAKPVGVMSNGNGVRQISCYSFDSNATPDPTMLYVKRYTKTDMAADAELDEYLIDLVSWVCAGRVFAAQGDMNKGKICDENASALMI